MENNIGTFQDIIKQFLDGQPPQWRLGVNAAQELVCTWVTSPDEATKGFASMLLSYSAFLKTEGYLGGVYTMMDAIRARTEALGENSVATELLTALAAERDHVTKNVELLYGQVFSSLVGGMSDQAPVVRDASYFEAAFKRYFTDLEVAFSRIADAP